jgi:hypothetical protein
VLPYFRTTRLRRPNSLRAGWDGWWRIVVGRILVVWAYRLVVIAVIVVIVIFVAFRRWLVRIVGTVAIV